jgi:hypothetical protein
MDEALLVVPSSCIFDKQRVYPESPLDHGADAFELGLAALEELQPQVAPHEPACARRVEGGVRAKVRWNRRAGSGGRGG